MLAQILEHTHETDLTHKHTRTLMTKGVHWLGLCNKQKDVPMIPERKEDTRRFSVLSEEQASELHKTAQRALSSGLAPRRLRNGPPNIELVANGVMQVSASTRTLPKGLLTGVNLMSRMVLF